MLGRGLWRSTPQLPLPAVFRSFAVNARIAALLREVESLRLENPPDTVRLINANKRLAGEYALAGERNEAKSQIDRLLILMKSDPTLDDFIVGNTLCKVGVTLNFLGESEKAEECLLSALEHYEKLKALKEYSSIEAYCALGSVNFSQSEFAESDEYFQLSESCARASGLKGAVHLSDLNSSWMLGYLWFFRFKEAKLHAYRWFRAKMALRRSQMTVLDAAMLIENIYSEPEGFDRKDIEHAILLISKKLESDLKNFGDMDRNVAIDYSLLGRAHYILGQYEEAESAFFSEIRSRKTGGADESALASAHITLFKIYHAQKKYAKATFHSDEVLNILQNKEKLKGELGDAMYAFGARYHRSGEWKVAEKMYRGAIAAFKEAGPEAEYFVGRLMVDLAQVLELQDSKKSAEMCLMEGTQILLRTAKKGDTQLIHGCQLLAEVFEKTGHTESALNIYYKALTHLRCIHSPSSESIVKTTGKMITLFFKLNRLPEAEYFCHRLIFDIERDRKESEYDFKNIVESLYSVKVRLGKVEECEELRKAYPQLIRK